MSIINIFLGFFQFSRVAIQCKNFMGSNNRFAVHTMDRQTEILAHFCSILNGYTNILFYF